MKTVSEKISFIDTLTLQSGDVLSGFELMTETYGELNSDKSNAVLVCHAFSGNHHACLLYTSPSPRDGLLSRMPSSA